MINANAARSLYQQPTYQLTEVEETIKSRAKVSDFTCFDAKRWANELTNTLWANGFEVTINTIGDVIVSWKEAQRNERG